MLIATPKLGVDESGKVFESVLERVAKPKG